MLEVNLMQPEVGGGIRAGIKAGAKFGDEV